jgi:hypothetical protein
VQRTKAKKQKQQQQQQQKQHQQPQQPQQPQHMINNHQQPQQSHLINQQQMQQQQVVNQQQQQHLQKGTSNNMNVDDFEYGPNVHGELDQGCRKCNVMFGSSTELKLHFATSHNRQTFECFVCNKLFLQKYNFLAHIERFHDNMGKSFPCQFCDKVNSFNVYYLTVCVLLTENLFVIISYF